MKTPKIVFYSAYFGDYFTHFTKSGPVKILIGEGRGYYMFFVDEKRLEKWNLAPKHRLSWDRRIKQNRARQTPVEVLVKLGLT